MTTIIRNRNDGTLLIEGAPGSPQRTPVVLRGGAYDLFYAPRGSAKALVRRGTTRPIIADYGVGSRPCQPQGARPQGAFQPWEEGANEFGEFFRAMTDSRCNFLRVFLSLATRRNAAGLLNMVPFEWELRDGRVVYDVKGAVGGRWNANYFARLTEFVRQADEAGVVVQLSLFNYYDIAPDKPDVTYMSSNSQFAASPWNAANCKDKTWGGNHLIKLADGNPQVQFTSTSDNTGKLWLVQNAYIERVMSAVAGRSNVVLEIMNEPHQVFDLRGLERVARFDSAMTAIIKTHRGERQSPLISVNATYQIRNDEPTGRSDVEFWYAKRAELPHFADVDIVSYHALTAKPSRDINCCGGPTEVERVDQAAIDERAKSHTDEESLRKKALIFSTDAVLGRPFKHHYPDEKFEMLPRDGQIECAPGKDDTTLDGELTKTNVFHWATKCLKLNVGAQKGKYHFQNHSTFKAALVKVGQAVAEAGL